jgi:hypothetical protein
MRAEAVRLVPRPVFLLSSFRSGSTLLRCILNSHPDVCAPHELYLRSLTVEMQTGYSKLAMSLLDYDPEDLRFLLWDRLFDELLRRSGKRVLVDKTPSNVWILGDLRRCWPEARFIVLRRHPADIVASLVRADEGREEGEAVEIVNQFGDALDAVLRDGATATLVRYEDLTASPQAVCGQLCAFLEVAFEPEMIHYGRHDHGPLVDGVGDWSERIRSGRIQAAPPVDAPRRTPSALLPLCRRWGYAA